ncbi:unnamed protein product [Notodromas monacha]|uniref:AB hydrolase-1 domain-containing protein n=1 Tax=Notodromas monacha TaxID=399045 RepID=A0A7R9BQA7_9CRUS|nr:unnamed protein product [Notodromas monacha]CAG0918826.1 unnamed protein product [Notodromas monacha]
MSRMSRQHTAQHIPIHTSSRRPDPFTRELLLDFKLHKIWTITLPYERLPGLPKSTPLVMLHGFGVGSAFFCMNLENVAIGRTVYALDLPGFGRSSRPEFPNDALKIEQVFMGMLDQWRQAMHLDSFILLGHGFGGFIAASYAASFPERVEHLILADPWGLEAHPEGINWNKPIPTWIKNHYDWEWAHAGGFLRACGPLGPLAVRGFSHYICKRFLGGDSWAAADYVYQCNAVDNKSTEDAIMHLSKKILWARNPALLKLKTLPLDFFVSFIYGEDSWLDPSPAEQFQNCRLRGTADLHLIPGVGHDSYAEDPPAFNQIVNGICSWVDSRKNVATLTPNAAMMVNMNRPGPSRI